MDKRIVEELTEDELFGIVGGAEYKSLDSGEQCPQCKTGKLKKQGNAYVCSSCYKTFVKEHCSSCNAYTYCTEYSGGRYKCVQCSGGGKGQSVR